MHRLLSETGQETERQQVEESVHETVHSELAFTVFPLLMDYHLLSDTGVSGILGDEGDIAVHVAVEFYVLHHLLPVRLEAAVHVVEGET